MRHIAGLNSMVRTGNFVRSLGFIPTYVNGSAEAYCQLKHGSRLSFGGKVQLRLINLTQEQDNRRRLTIVLTLMVLASLAGAAVFFLMR
jgi:hypothetical protein